MPKHVLLLFQGGSVMTGTGTGKKPFSWVVFFHFKQLAAYEYDPTKREMHFIYCSP